MPEHIRYVFGYPNGKVEPDDTLSRAEMCTLLFHLMSAEDKNAGLPDRFPDVKSEA